MKAGAVHKVAVVVTVTGRVPRTTETVLGANQKWYEDDQGFKITAPTEPSASCEPGILQAASADNLDFQSHRNLPALAGSRLIHRGLIQAFAGKCTNSVHGRFLKRIGVTPFKDGPCAF